MKFNKFYITNNEGKSNCVIRTFCKIFDEEYNNVYNDLCCIAKQLGCNSFNDILVFEKYMEIHDTIQIEDYKDKKIKDLIINNGSYVVFCWDKKDFYHMIPIIEGVIYDKDDSCLELYVIDIYKQNTYTKK